MNGAAKPLKPCIFSRSVFGSASEPTDLNSIIRFGFQALEYLLRYGLKAQIADQIVTFYNGFAERAKLIESASRRAFLYAPDASGPMD